MPTLFCTSSLLNLNRLPAVVVTINQWRLVKINYPLAQKSNVSVAKTSFSKLRVEFKSRAHSLNLTGRYNLDPTLFYTKHKYI